MQDRIPLVINYSRALPDIKRILRINETVFRNHEEIKNIISDKTMISYRRQENLKDILVHKKHNKIFNKPDNETKKCTRKICVLCKYVIVSKTFKDNDGN